jgi:hypothetical protein
MRLGPNERLGWIMMDAYERRQPTAAGANFYAAAEWLYADEPTIKRMVADARQRLGPPKPIDVKPIVEGLQQFEAVRWPSAEKSTVVAWLGERIPSGWDVAVAAHQLLPEHPDQARELAYRYYAWSMGLGDVNGPRIFANHLIHAIDAAAPPPHP